MSYKKDRGFTLIELLIVIIIIGILAAVALPQFNKTKEHALGKEAIANLKLIAAAEKIYRMENENNYYYPSSGNLTNISDINTNLKLSLTEANWDYGVVGGESSFTAYALRNGSGGYLECRYALPHNDSDGEPNPDECP